MTSNKTPSSVIESCQRFFVAGISRSITSDDLRTHFSRFGNVNESRVQRDASGLSLGYGWVGFDKPCHSLLDIEHRINGQVLDVQIPKNLRAAAQNAPQVKEVMRNGPPPPSPQQAHLSSSSAGINSRKRSRSRSGDHRHRSHSGGRRRSRSRNNSRVYNRDVGYDSRNPHPPPPPGPPPVAPREAHRVGPSCPPQSAASHHTQPIHVHSVQRPQPPPPPKHPMHSHMQSIPPLGSLGDSDFFVCIPSALCPPQYMRDPRVFFATLDQSGVLHQTPLPLGNAPPLPQANFNMRSYPLPSSPAPQQSYY